MFTDIYIANSNSEKNKMFCFFRIPNLKIIGEGSEQAIEISDDPYDTSPLNVDNVPVMVTLNKVNNFVHVIYVV